VDHCQTHKISLLIASPEHLFSAFPHHRHNKFPLTLSKTKAKLGPKLMGGGYPVRVTGGAARGRTLKSLHVPHLRPTSDRVRGALFSMLESLGVDLSSVLDLYAGTGALGIEALSRGGERAVFVERDQKLCRLIQENLRETGMAERGQVLRMSAAEAVTTLEGPFTLALADPPYGDEDAVVQLLRLLVPSRAMAEGGLLVLEHSSRLDTQQLSVPGWRLLRQRQYGDTAVSIYEKERSAA